jgi:Family of unknown function (DUF6527)
MKLTELDPHWVGAGGEGISDKDGNPVPERHGVGLSFLCPCPQCTAKRTGDPDRDFYLRHFVEFANPLDGGPPHDGRVTWQRTGDTFETLTLTPSILSDPAKGGCGWHGFVTNGEVT